MRNLLFSEYEAEVKRIAPLWLGTVERHTIHWTSGLGMTCFIELRGDSGAAASVPTARVGSSSTLPVDVSHALTLCLDSADTLRRCMSAHMALAGIRVWLNDAPCDSCRATGWVLGGACSRCNGTGKRTEASDV